MAVSARTLLALAVFGFGGLAPAGARAQSADDDVRRLIAEESGVSGFQSVSSYRLETGDSLGGVTLSGSRTRDGRKRDCDVAMCGAWYRDHTGQAEGWVEIAEGVSLVSHYTVSRQRRGNAEGALLTVPTRGVSQEFAIGLRGADRTVTLCAFDRARWSSAPIADLAERVANGEARARRGFGIEYADEQPFGGLEASAGLVAERATGFDGEAEHRLAFRLRGRF